MHPGLTIVEFAINRPKFVVGLMALVSLALIALAVAPTLAPDAFAMLAPVTVDTDPENMLNKHEPVRVFHNKMKQVLDLHDMVVVGVVNEEHEHGVFNVDSLRNIYELTQFAKTLRGEGLGLDDPDAGVVLGDMIAPSLVDNIEQGGPGEVVFEWLMNRPPETEDEARAVFEKAKDIPFLYGTLVSEDGKGVALYLPLSSKDLSYRVYTRLNAKIAELKDAGAAEEYHITGLPVAEDVFGVQMFIQMGISAPLAMLAIFLLMAFFFRKMVLIISPLLLAMVSVIITMGLLIVTGNTIHIMSSMIPIFIMPIAVLDSIHILSEFFDRYQETRDRRKTITHVVETLFVPMLYTSLTSAAGFASLALTPIPPVQVFGIFVAFGILLAWLLTITFIPAYIVLMPEKRLEGFGVAAGQAEEAGSKTFTGRLLLAVGGFTFNHARLVIVGAVVLLVAAVYGITLIRVNDNPTKWFKSDHPIRVADRALNSHFGGTYMAYLAFSPKGQPPEVDQLDYLQEDQGQPADRLPVDAIGGGLEEDGAGDEPALPGGLSRLVGMETAHAQEPGLPEGLGGEDQSESEPGLPAGLGGEPARESEPEPATQSAQPQTEIFKHPAVLEYLADLQAHLNETGVVGKSNSLTDIVKTVHRELRDGTEQYFTVPDSKPAVAQTLMQYQSSHRPGDLWHFVTPDYRHTSIWVQLKSGDNLDMQHVVDAIDAYVADNPPVFELDGETVELEPSWFGKTYLNVVWQQKMVSGMRDAFLGSFLVVLLMMILLFRSGLWGLLSMVPLTLTIALIYGFIGFIGKDYDMPVAVLSSLTLGLAVDFAIHFLARTRALAAEHGSWAETWPHTFGEPGRAIWRNVIVIAVGFLPLLLAPLVPYITVGFFMASILLLSGAATLVLLPALVRVLEPLLFPQSRAAGVTCKCGTCILSAVVAVALVAVNLHSFLEQGVTWLTWVSVAALPVIAIVCWTMSRRSACGAGKAENEG